MWSVRPFRQQDSLPALGSSAGEKTPCRVWGGSVSGGSYGKPSQRLPLICRPSVRERTLGCPNLAQEIGIRKGEKAPGHLATPMVSQKTPLEVTDCSPTRHLAGDRRLCRESNSFCPSCVPCPANERGSHRRSWDGTVSRTKHKPVASQQRYEPLLVS